MMAAKTVSELAELFGVTRQAMNNRVRGLEEDFLEKNAKGYTVVNNAGVHELERLYGRVVTAEQEVVDKPREKRPLVRSQDRTAFDMLSRLMTGKDQEIARLGEQLAAKDQQLQMLGGQIVAKDHQIAEKDKQLDQQQQLTAAALQDREQMLADREHLMIELREERSKGFWARVFGGGRRK